jgi:hypothetical protein
MKKLILLLMLPATLCQPLFAQDRSSTVTLDFDKGTISPGDPTINLLSRPSVVLEIQPAGEYSIFPTGWKSFVNSSLSPLLVSRYIRDDLKAHIRQEITNPSEYDPSRLRDVLRSVRDSLDRSTIALTDASVTGTAPKSDLRFLAGGLPVDTFNAIAAKVTTAASPDEKRKILDQHLSAIASDKASLDQVAAATTPADRAVLNFVKGSKDRTPKRDGEWSWTITMKAVTRDYPIDVVCTSVSKDSKNAACPKAHMVAVIHVETATYDFSWSAGLAVTSLRDARYRIDKNADPTKDSALVPNGRQGYPYQLATAINYCLTSPKWSWVCPATVGLSADVPVDKLTILFGPAARFRPLDIKNAFYLSAGVSYGTKKVLNDDYAGRSTVPPGITTSSIYSDRRTFGAYVGVTFGFLGSSKQFTGVFSGSSKDTVSADGK